MEGEKKRVTIIVGEDEQAAVLRFLEKIRKTEPCFGCGQPVVVGGKICPHCGLNLMATYA